MEGGIDYLRSVIMDDRLGLNSQLEQQLAALRATVRCEWKVTLEEEPSLSRFAHFINSSQRDPDVQWVAERDQHRPARVDERIAVTLIEETER